jgi:hypothetical protein
MNQQQRADTGRRCRFPWCDAFELRTIENDYAVYSKIWAHFMCENSARAYESGTHLFFFEGKAYRITVSGLGYPNLFEHILEFRS